MRHDNENFANLHEKVSVRTLCATKLKPFLKDQL